MNRIHCSRCGQKSNALISGHCQACFVEKCIDDCVILNDKQNDIFNHTIAALRCHQDKPKKKRYSVFNHLKRIVKGKENK